MVSAIDTILSTFSECTLAPCEGIPNHGYLTAINMYLNQCSSGIHSNLGDGTLGYLILTATPVVYASVSTLNFVRPINPGPTAIIPNPAPAAAVIGQLTREHAENHRVFLEYATTDAACKKVIMSLIPDVFYRTLKHNHTGYATVTSLEILSHLWSEYGQLSDFEFQQNDLKIKTPITTETHFEDLVSQIETGRNTVVNQNPYSDPQIVSIAYTLIDTIGVHIDGCREWRRKNAVDKTWTQFKTHFSREFKDFRESNRTAVTAGYAQYCSPVGLANEAYIAEIDAKNEKFTEEYTAALANLATATSADRATVTALTNTNATLTAQINALYKRIESCTCSATTRNGTPHNGPPRNATPHNGPPRNHPNQRNRPRGQPANPDPDGYCWTHGYLVAIGHTSATCTCCLTNLDHQVTATRTNNMGGLQKNKPANN